ncbi:MAG: sigma-70 family RNA polymerase sigma factor [Alphaproteobacteria bacterium]|nr:sigma-70 family RNA polymerase sigma factor [Alphaproteobacteria bacterium]MCB9696481.1 sigma-70 family RNA polymerase sigma factor [Alphaproteobacteria bacterium]
MSTALAEHSDEDLARKAAAGDEQALGELLARSWPEIRRVALVRVGDPVLADDAVQDALVRLLRFADRFDPTRPFRPWMRQLVRNACVDLFRRRGRGDDPLVEVAANDTDPGRTMDLDRGARRVREAFASLSERQREIWLRCEQDGASVADVAAELDIAPATVRVVLHQARKALRLRLLAEDPELAELVRDA